MVRHRDLHVDMFIDMTLNSKMGLSQSRSKWVPLGILAVLQLTGHLAMGGSNTPLSYLKELPSFVPKVDNVIHRINHCPVYKCYAVHWMVIYPPDSVSNNPGLVSLTHNQPFIPLPMINTANHHTPTAILPDSDIGCKTSGP